MKRIFFFIFVMIIVSNIHAQYFPVDTAKLNSSYRVLMNEPNSIRYQKEFFDAFPSTWMEFIMTYQYVPAEEYDLTMYFLADRHISTLGKITLIPDSIYCKKMVDIAIGGKLNADAPNYLLWLLHDVMKMKTHQMFEYISKLEKGYQMLFWQFYWSSMLPNKEFEKECKSLKMSNEDEYPVLVQIMCDVYKYFHDGIYLGYKDFPYKDSIPWKVPRWKRNTEK